MVRHSEQRLRAVEARILVGTMLMDIFCIRMAYYSPPLARVQSPHALIVVFYYRFQSPGNTISIVG